MFDYDKFIRIFINGLEIGSKSLKINELKQKTFDKLKTYIQEMVTEEHSETHVVAERERD